MAIVTFRICSGEGFIATNVDGERVQYDPRLEPPIEIGSRINAEQYGQIVRGEANAGEINIAFDDKIWYLLRLGWKGRNIRIYKGLDTSTLNEFDLLYTGRVDDLTFETNAPKLSIKTTDASLDLDSVLVDNLYNDAALAAVRGRPYPFLRGTVYSIAPVLENDVNQIYRMSIDNNIETIMRVSVGGVDWDQSETNPPGPGQWWSNLPGGVFYLGSETDGGEVRVDCKAIGWESCNSAQLIQEIVELGGGEIDIQSFNQFHIDAPELIGFYQGTEPINRLDVLDIIVNGIGGWWFFGEDEKIYAGIIAEPDIESDFTLTDVEIDEFTMMGILPPAYRIRIEYKRNWQPVTTFFAIVSVVDQQAMSGDGLNVVYQNNDIKLNEPRAVDVPLIRSLVWREEDAESIRDRLASAWGETRYIYEATAKSDVPKLYSTMRIDFLMVEGFFRLHSGIRSIGGGLSKFQFWGAANIRPETEELDIDDSEIMPGVFYVEFEVLELRTDLAYAACVGICGSDFDITNPIMVDSDLPQGGWGAIYAFYSTSKGYGDPVRLSDPGGVAAVGDVIGLVIDTVNGMLYGVNVSQAPNDWAGAGAFGTADPVAGTGGYNFRTGTGLVGNVYLCAGGSQPGNANLYFPSVRVNSGGSAWVGVMPSVCEAFNPVLVFDEGDMAPELGLSDGGLTVAVISQIVGSDQPTAFVRSDKFRKQQ